MKQLVWDLPTRFFHWLLAIAVVAAFVIAKVVEKETPVFYLHVIFGVLAGLLIVWRVFWGFFGSRHALWKDVLVSPGSVFAYFTEVFKGRGAYYAGHNPGGAITVVAILVGVAGTVASGLLIAQAELFEELHEALPVIVIVLVVVHVVGVLLATKMHQENYALSMITGHKRAEPGQAIPHASVGAASLMMVLVLGLWSYFITGFDRQTAVFTAPGTQWTFQIGEPEAGENESGEDGSGESAGEDESGEMNDDD